MNARGMKTNLILAALLIALSAAVYVYELKGKSGRQKEEEARTKLLALDENAELEGVRIVDKSSKISLELECRQNCKLSDPNSKWEITKPVQFSADGTNVNTFVSSLSSATIQETLPLEGDAEAALKNYGLDKARREQKMAVIRLKGQSEPYAVYIGDQTAVGESVYAYATGPGLKDNAVRIVPGFLKSSTERDLNYWRAKRLFQFAASEVEGLTLTNPAGTTRLVKENGDWFLMPGKRPADNETVDTFITGLVFTNAQNYVSDNKAKDKAKLSLMAPKYTVRVKVMKQPEVLFELYDVTRDKQPKLFGIVGHKNFIAELDRTNVEKFTKRERDFRFKNLVSGEERQQTTAIELAFRGKEQVEVRGPEALDPLMAKLTAARIAEFLDGGTVPSGQPELSSWVLKAKEAAKPIKAFTIYGSPDKGEYYVRFASGEVAKLERGSGSSLPSKPDELKPAQAKK